MQIIATPNSPYGNASDRSFKTVGSALTFILRSYFVKGGVARHVAVYNMTAPLVRFDFTEDMEIILTSGSVDDWNVGDVKTLTQALKLVKTYHHEG